MPMNTEEESTLLKSLDPLEEQMDVDHEDWYQYAKHLVDVEHIDEVNLGSILVGD